MLRDGRIGFIDFGIVGRIPPTTWLALQSLAAAFQDSNFDLMARCTAHCSSKLLCSTASAADPSKYAVNIYVFSWIEMAQQ